MRNIWVHHNSVQGGVRLLGGATTGPKEALDIGDAKLSGPKDPASQAIVRAYPRDQRLIFAWANAFAMPKDGKEIGDYGLRDDKFAKRFRYVWLDGNLVDGKVMELGGLKWDEFTKACGFEEHGETGNVEFDEEGRLPKKSKWREKYGRDSYVNPPETKTR
jgi:hypothetical protein